MENQTSGLASLFAKIAIISGEIGAVTADKKHGQGYMYHSSDAILGALRGLMSKHGLVVIPNAPHVQIVNDVWLISYQFVICDAETGATFTAEWASSAPMKMGSNYDDKAMGKAHTYSHKYFLMKLFLVSSADNDDLDDDAAPAKTAKKEDKAPKSTPPAKKDPLDPESHGLGNSKDTVKLFTTKPITEVETRQQDEKSKPYIVAEKMTIFSREPFRELDYDAELIEDLAKVGKHSLLEDEAFKIIFCYEGQKKVPLKIVRVNTNREFEIK